MNKLKKLFSYLNPLNYIDLAADSFIPAEKTIVSISRHVEPMYTAGSPSPIGYYHDDTYTYWSDGSVTIEKGKGFVLNEIQTREKPNA